VSQVLILGTTEKTVFDLTSVASVSVIGAPEAGDSFCYNSYCQRVPSDRFIYMCGTTFMLDGISVKRWAMYHVGDVDREV
jgi:hypothetical protein